MQSDLDSSYPELEVQILGVNATGLATGNASITAGRDIPWLQDVPGVDVWDLWDVNYRDVIILDSNNALAGVFNLTTHGLHYAENYNALRELLIERSAVPEPGTFALVGLGLMMLAQARRAS